MKFKVGDVVVCNDLSLLCVAGIEQPKRADIFVGEPFTIDNVQVCSDLDEEGLWGEGITMCNEYYVPLSALTLFKAAENKPAKVEWEDIDSGSMQRSKTPTGWLVREVQGVCHINRGNDSYITDGYDWRVALTFVPDPEHAWLRPLRDSDFGTL